MSLTRKIIYVFMGLSVIGMLITISIKWPQAYSQTHTFVKNYNSGVRAERYDMYERVNHGDLAELTHGDNQKAINANQQAQQQGQKAPYPKSKDGNYWSYFVTHKSISHGDGNTSLIASFLGTDHPHRHIYFVDNQKVLENHGINGGVNFN